VFAVRVIIYFGYLLVSRTKFGNKKLASLHLKNTQNSPYVRNGQASFPLTADVFYDSPCIFFFILNWLLVYGGGGFSPLNFPISTLDLFTV